MYRLAEQQNCHAADNGSVFSSAVAHIFIRNVSRERCSMDGQTDKRTSEWDAKKIKRGEKMRQKQQQQQQKQVLKWSLNGEWKKAMRGASVSDGRKIQKGIERNSFSVEATGKAKLFCTIIKYSVVDCLDVSTCSYVFQKKKKEKTNIVVFESRRSFRCEFEFSSIVRTKKKFFVFLVSVFVFCRISGNSTYFRI